MRKEADCLRALRAGHSSHCARCPWLAPPRLRAVLCCAEFAVFIPDPRVGLSRQTFLLICSTRVRLNNSDLSCCMAALCAHCEKTPAWGRDLEFACPVRPTQDRPGGEQQWADVQPRRVLLLLVLQQLGRTKDLGFRSHCFCG